MFTNRFVSRLTKDTLALILAGGRGTRLEGLTQWRVKPAVPFGGKFRIIDFPLSNCVNSGVRRIGVLTQYKSHSLIRHIQRGWAYMRGELGEFIEILPAQQRHQDSWYSGTADAVFQNLDILRNHHPGFVLVLAGDHVYKMDYGPMLAYHLENNADLTIACLEVPLAQASSFGVLETDSTQRVVRFEEKPSRPGAIPDRPDCARVSMGIYVFNRDFLIQQLIEDAGRENSSHDFGRDIIPAVIDQYRVFAYPFRSSEGDTQAYWRDVGTIDSYWQANMELIGVTPELNLYDQEWPIWTYQEQVPPSKFVFNDDGRRGMAVDSMVSGGAIVSGAFINHSLLFTNVTVEDHSVVEDAVLLPDVKVGQHCRIRRAVIDKGAQLPDRTEIGFNPQQDAKRFHMSPSGIVLVTPEMLGQRLHYTY